MKHNLEELHNMLLEACNRSENRIRNLIVKAKGLANVKQETQEKSEKDREGLIRPTVRIEGLDQEEGDRGCNEQTEV